MAAKYLIRLDDANHYQCSFSWKWIEEILDKYNVKPIVAVVPDCRDNEISFTTNPNNNFWSLVKSWEAKGWSIGVHGLHHTLHRTNANLNVKSSYSEFTSFDFTKQLEILKSALDVFYQNNIKPKYFVAPAHGYDLTTIEIIKYSNCGLILSDGMNFHPYEYYGLCCLPQQISKLICMPFGTWTIAIHPNNFTCEDFYKFERFLHKISKNLIDPNCISSFYNIPIIDDLFELVFKKIRLFNKLKNVIPFLS